MIIKIKVYPEKEEEKENIGWWIVDNIIRIGVEPTTMVLDTDIEGGVIDYFVESPKYLVCSNSVTKFVCWMKDGTRKVICFQTEAYLLNDEGKTIEKFVA